MQVSVAIATYNGAAFLERQLRSIEEQDRAPDEVVVCDDTSRDGTVAILRRFAAAAPFPVRVEVNDRNLGVVANFEKAISLCRGDAIVLADQDDVWKPQKLARLTQVLAQRPEVGMVFSDAETIDAADRVLDYRLWSAIRFTAREQRRVNTGDTLAILLNRNVVTGATMAFRARYLDLIRPIPTVFQHDAWIALLIATVADCAAIPEPLIQYRQHPQQQLGEKPLSFFEQYAIAQRQDAASYRLRVERHEAARQRVAERTANRAAVAQLAAKVAHLQAKVRMREGAWRLPLVARELFSGNYGRYGHGWKSVAQDLLL